jgi:hypothetical protein
MITLLLHLLRLLPFLCGGHRQLALENLGLRHQLALYRRAAPRPKLRTTDRLFWVGLARVRRQDKHDAEMATTSGVSPLPTRPNAIAIIRPAARPR